MAKITGFMTITGHKSGQIEGDVTQSGQQGTVLVEDLTYSVASPLDPASGLATGKRRHEPVRVTVPSGRQTPLVFTAATTNEVLQVQIDVYRPDAKGEQVPALSIKLTNAAVAVFDLSLEGQGAAVELLDMYSFTFQQIELVWITGGFTGSDNWGADPG